MQRDRNWDAMKSGGISIYLKASVETVWDRIKDDDSRPLLQVDDPVKTASELLEKRTPMYERADIIVSTDDLSPKQVTDEILSILNGS